MENTEKVLLALKGSAKAMKAGEIVDATGLTRAEVDKAMKILKDSGQIVSPVRCCWQVS